MALNKFFLNTLLNQEALLSVLLIVFCFVFASFIALLIFLVKKTAYKNKIYCKLMDNVPNGVIKCVKDDVLTIIYCNESFLSITGYTRKELQNSWGYRLINLIFKDDIPGVYKSLHEQLSRGNLFEFRFRIACKGGTTVWTLFRGHKSHENGLECLYGVLLNITENINSENRQKIDEERYRIVAESSDSVIFEYNLKEKTAYYTNKYRYKFGEEPITINIPESIIESGRIHEQDLKKFVAAYSQMISGSPSGREEVRIRKANGEFIWCQVRYNTILDEKGIPIKAVGKIIDIDKQKKETENLIKANQIDSFTGLYNKISVLKLIDKYINENKERNHALFFIDIDNFKYVNDSFGHMFGDTVLLEIASRIKNQFRYSDIVGRIGGDEFIVLLKDFIDEDFITEKAQALCKSVSSVAYEGYDFSITTSAGISVYPSDGKTLSELYEKADIALYGAKSEGKNRFRLYSNDLCPRQYLTGGNAALGEKAEKGQEDHTSFLLSVSELLHNTNDIDRTVNDILQKLGTRFALDRVYIYESSLNGMMISNTYEWCASELRQRRNKLQDLEFDSERYKEQFSDENLFYCQDVTEIPSDLQSKIDYSGVSTFIQCGLIEDGKFKGFIGFDVCGTFRLWKKEEIETLSYTAKTLGMFLTPKRLDEIVTADYEKKKAVLGNIDIPAFIIDPEKYGIIFMNKSAAGSGINIGSNVFESVCGSGIPCKMCEINNLKNPGDSFTCEKKGGLGDLKKITATRLLWENGNPAILFYYKN